MPLPGFAGYRPGIASLAPQATGPRRLSRVPRTTIRTFNAQYAGGFLSARSWNQNAFHGLRRLDNGSAPSWPHPKAGESMTTLAQASLHVADRTIAHAPLPTRPLDHARGHHYQGPRRLPGPDSHRQAALNLSLLYVMSTIPSSQRRSSLGAHRAEVMETPKRPDESDRSLTPSARPPVHLVLPDPSSPQPFAVKKHRSRSRGDNGRTNRPMM